jgi:hypothetical protein
MQWSGDVGDALLELLWSARASVTESAPRLPHNRGAGGGSAMWSMPDPALLRTTAYPPPRSTPASSSASCTMRFASRPPPGARLRRLDGLWRLKSLAGLRAGTDRGDAVTQASGIRGRVPPSPEMTVASWHLCVEHRDRVKPRACGDRRSYGLRPETRTLRLAFTDDARS